MKIYVLTYIDADYEHPGSTYVCCWLYRPTKAELHTEMQKIKGKGMVYEPGYEPAMSDREYFRLVLGQEHNNPDISFNFHIKIEDHLISDECGQIADPESAEGCAK